MYLFKLLVTVKFGPIVLIMLALGHHVQAVELIWLSPFIIFLYFR